MFAFKTLGHQQITFDELIEDKNDLFECNLCKSKDTQWTKTITIGDEQQYFLLFVNVHGYQGGNQMFVDLPVIGLNVDEVLIHG